MAFSKVKEHYDELKKDLKLYLETKIEFLELRLLKKVTEIGSRILKFVLGVVLLIFFLIFVSFGAAIWIGDYLGNMSYGFFIIAGFYLFILILILLFGKYFFRARILKSLSFKMIQIRKIKF